MNQYISRNVFLLTYTLIHRRNFMSGSDFTKYAYICFVRDYDVPRWAKWGETRTTSRQQTLLCRYRTTTLDNVLR